MSIRYGDKEIKAITYTTRLTFRKGPCENGFHVPKKEEYVGVFNAGVSLGLWSTTNGIGMVRYLKLPLAGRLFYNSGAIDGRGTMGIYMSCESYTVGHSKCLYVTSNKIDVNEWFGKSYGLNIRGFKDDIAIPDSSWDVIYKGSGTSGIYHNPSQGIISISSDGNTRYTLADKNVGATTVYNYGDTLTEYNCGGCYQWGNIYKFPFTGPIKVQSGTVDLSGYGPLNPYSSDIYRTSTWDSSNNYNIWGGEEEKDFMINEHNIKEVWWSDEQGILKQVRPMSCMGKIWDDSYKRNDLCHWKDI